MYPRCNLGGFTRLNRTNDLLSAFDHDKARNTTHTAESRGVFVRVDVALINRQVGEFFQYELPINPLTCPAPVGGEID